MTFKITNEDFVKILTWKKEQDDKWPHKEFDKPYFGAIGGSLTYMFTPTELGVITEIKHANGEVLDLTDYNW